ncbi:MAG: hypothetical protein KIT69_14265 [Propionibacteriaceae bacterium]|nr:TnpV protein [Actinomycetota bacterium]MCW5953414.1 hypothetical protein [Propionibacteriaceae bacterium]
MNRFERAAREAWAELAPSAVATLEDPSLFFSELASQAETAWLELSAQLAGPMPPEETYLERVSRLESAKRQAAELVINDWCRPPAAAMEDSADEQDQTSRLVHQLAREVAAATDTDV